MPETLSVSREYSGTGIAADFFDEAKNGRDETTSVPGGYGSYPKVHAVTIGDQTFFGFDTTLPEEREPWNIGFLPVNRDTVLSADGLTKVDGGTKELVNSLIDKMGDGSEPTFSLEEVRTITALAADADVTMSDGGSCCTDSTVDATDADDEEGLGDPTTLFG